MRYLGEGNGSSGVIALGSYTQDWYSCSGTSGASTLSATGTFSAGDRIGIIQSRGTGAGNAEDNTVASYTAGTITLVHELENTYTDSGASQAQVAVIEEASEVTGSYTVPAWDGNVDGLFWMACNGPFKGTVNANGKGFRGASSVSGVVGSTGNPGKQGEGSLSDSGTSSTSANSNGGGGGGVGADGGGGGAGGGYATAGNNGGAGQGSGGAGGLEVGQEQITSIFPGGGGGSGAGESNDNEGPHTSGSGGIGGGIIIIYTNKLDSISSLTSNGIDGGTYSGHTGIDSAGQGGGGAGGTILIKSILSNVSGIITASGGSGPSNSFSGGEGGDGSVGRIRIESCSVTGTTNPTASEDIGGHSYCGGGIYLI